MILLKSFIITVQTALNTRGGTKEKSLTLFCFMVK